MVKNILEDIEYTEPDPTLPIPAGMCKDCLDDIAKERCENCKDISENENG